MVPYNESAQLVTLAILLQTLGHARTRTQNLHLITSIFAPHRPPPPRITLQNPRQRKLRSHLPVFHQNMRPPGAFNPAAIEFRACLSEAVGMTGRLVLPTWFKTAIKCEES